MVADEAQLYMPAQVDQLGAPLVHERDVEVGCSGRSATSRLPHVPGQRRRVEIGDVLAPLPLLVLRRGGRLARITRASSTGSSRTVASRWCSATPPAVDGALFGPDVRYRCCAAGTGRGEPRATG